MPILTTVLDVIDLLMKASPVIIKVGSDLRPFAESLYKQFKGQELTDDERSALQAAVDAKYANFMRPQSPAQPGDPDYVKPSA